ncbi:MAG: CHAT domain-containing protein [Sedimentisphaeraceae bacterium JB056]
MSMISSYRNQIQRITKDIAKLQTDLSKEAKIIADAKKNINRVNRSITSNTSQSIICSKMREIERYEDKTARSEQKRADLENKKARKTEELNRIKERLDREELRETDKQMRQQKQTFDKINYNLETQSRLIKENTQAVRDLQKPIEQITVLFFASNPHLDLRLDEEMRAIDEMVRKSEHRDSVILQSKWAVRPADILQGINEYSPQIIHFSGHGSETGELVLQDDAGQAKLIDVDAMVQVMVASSSSIRFAFLNACYSHEQAMAIVEYVEAAIGMNAPIGDNAAKIFASQFYSAIGFGKSVKEAFEQAKALLMMEGIKEVDTPELFVADGVNAEDIILVIPENNVGDKS